MALTPTSLLAIDVGNTQITLGMFEGKTLRHSWRLQTTAHATADELGISLAALLKTEDREQRTDNSQSSVFRLPSSIIIASVVPPIDQALAAACEKYLHQKPRFVTYKTPLGIRIKTKIPSEVGADRLVNAVAVHALFNRAAIVVDFGTATTFDCVDPHGNYLGGVIAPGLQLASEHLALRTAKLPKVPFDIPVHAIGRTTKESLQSGIFWGYIGLVEKIVAELSREMKLKPTIVITGGLATTIGPRLKVRCSIQPDLTLEGLRLIWEKNTRRGKTV